MVSSRETEASSGGGVRAFIHWEVLPTVEIKRVMVMSRRMKYVGEGYFPATIFVNLEKMRDV